MIIIAELDGYISERECFRIELLEVLMIYLPFLVSRFLTLVRLEVEVKITGVYPPGVIYYIESGHGVAFGCSILMMTIMMIMIIIMITIMITMTRW